MSEVTDVLASFDSEHSSTPEPKELTKPDLPDTDAPAEKPEVAAQEAENKEAEKPETEAEKAAKEAHALKQRLKRETAKKYELRREIQALREQFAQATQGRVPQGEQAAPQGRVLSDEDIDRIAEERLYEREVAKQHNKLLEEGRKAVPDFDEMIVELHSELPMVVGNKPTPILDAITLGKSPVKVLQHLRDNPDLVAELASQSPAYVVRQLSLLDAELSQPIKKVSAAPKPIQPLSSGGKSFANVDEMNPGELLKFVRSGP